MTKGIYVDQDKTHTFLPPLKVEVGGKLTRFAEASEVVERSLGLRHPLLGQKPAMAFREWQHAEQGHQLVTTADQGDQPEVIPNAVPNPVENRYTTGHRNGGAQDQTAPCLGHTDLCCIDSRRCTGQSHANTCKYGEY